MSAIEGVKPGIWRWDGVDADHGFPIVGYIVNVTGHTVLVDPPGTSGDAGAIRGIGKPEGILLTNMWHVRGGPRWAETFEIPIVAPASASSELSEADGRLDVEVREGDTHFGWRALHLTAEHEGKTAFDEISYWHEATRTLIIGDLLAATEDGGVAYGPHLFAGVPVETLHPLTERLAQLSPRTLLSAHLGPRDDVGSLFGRVLSAK